MLSSLLGKTVELLAECLDVRAHLVGHLLDAFVGSPGARVVRVDGSLLGSLDGLVVILVGHRRPGRLQLVLGGAELDWNADRRAGLLRFVHGALRLRELRARQGTVARAAGSQRRCDRDPDEPATKSSNHLLHGRASSCSEILRGETSTASHGTPSDVGPRRAPGAAGGHSWPRARMMPAISDSSSKGFRRYSTAPARRARSRVAASLCAVMNTTGIRRPTATRRSY